MTLDIIIPAYNSKDTIYRCLFSIAIQKNMPKTTVYIINDCSSYNYSKEIDFFKDYLNIKELKLNKNSGPRISRQYGIDNSSNDYIMFIDSDDFLYDPFSISKLFEYANGIFDIIASDFIYERDNEVTIKKGDYAWLHGKIYKRYFLKNNDIRFNETRANEDNGFNRLCLFHNPLIKKINNITYVYSENKDSITRKNNRLYKFTGLKWLAYNINSSMEIALKKNLDEEYIFEVCVSLLVAMYYYYLELYDKYDVNKIIKWCKDTKKIYNKLKFKYNVESIIKESISIKKEEYKEKNIKEVISFDEFLNRIEEIL